MSKNLKYFMREAAEVEKVVTVPAPESFKDENGKVIQLEVKVLSSERIRAINEAYHTHTVALDKKGNPYINGGNVVFRDERDNAKATRHILVEALQYPKLDDPELMKYYNCVDITQMHPSRGPRKGSRGHPQRSAGADCGHHQQALHLRRTEMARNSVCKAAILFVFGGLAYFGLEVLFRGHSHWTMFVLGGFLFLIPVRLIS